VTDGGPGATTDGRRCFVVRTGETWALTPIPGSEPVTVDLAGVVAELRATDGQGGAPAPVPATTRPLDPDVEVNSAWMLVGEVVDGRLVVGTPDGGPIGLDEGDLALLDVVTTWTTPRQVAATTGADLDDLCRRGARLLVAAWLRGPEPQPLDAETEPVEPESEPAEPAGPPEDREADVAPGRSSWWSRRRRR
jgi:hypothetical protein